MSGIVNVKTLEQLKPYLNDKNLIEIAVRDKTRKFKAFQKIALNNLQDNQAEEALQNVANALKHNNILQANNLKKLEHLAKLNNIGILLNGLNLCATCAGFAMVLAKLDDMSKEINQKFLELEEDVKDIQDVNAGFRYREVYAEYQNMLDKKKVHKPYGEDELRELVDKEYNILSMLLETLQKDVSNDNTQLVCLIFTMASMLTCSLVEFDEQYYFNNAAVIENGDCWHLSHDQWLSVYETLSSDWMIEKLQDTALFDMNMDTNGVDIYTEELQDQVSDMKDEVLDNDMLISTINDPELLADMRNYNDQEFLDNVQTAVEQTAGTANNPEFVSVCENAAEQVAQQY